MLEFIRPSKPTQNAFIERFYRTWQMEILGIFSLFMALNEARENTERCLTEYNGEREHVSLNKLTAKECHVTVEYQGIHKKCVKLKRVCLHFEPDEYFWSQYSTTGV